MLFAYIKKINEAWDLQHMSDILFIWKTETNSKQYKHVQIHT